MLNVCLPHRHKSAALRFCVFLFLEKSGRFTCAFGDLLYLLYIAVINPSAYYINSLLNRNGGSLRWVAVSLYL